MGSKLARVADGPESAQDFLAKACRRFRAANPGIAGNRVVRGRCVGTLRSDVILIADSAGAVRFECDACGAQQAMRRFRSRPITGGERCEPEDGQWLRCGVCGDWSPLERVRPAAARTVSAR
jgi:predicted RNA-binding Zn-ribbon protein involved in translation (DUF1610 family)